jgi:hypothetical protein
MLQLLTIASLFYLLTVSTASGIRGLEEVDGIYCCLRVTESVYQNTTTGILRGEESISCETDPASDPIGGDPGQLYKIDLPVDFLAHNRAQLAQGKMCINVPGGTAIQDDYLGNQILIPKGATLSIVNPSDYHRSRRMVLKTTGVSTVLVLLIDTPYNTQPSAASNVSKYIFGKDSPTTATVFRDCSRGAKIIVPATGQGITNGVARMTFAFNFDTFNRDTSLGKIIVKAEGEKFCLHIPREKRV